MLLELSHDGEHFCSEKILHYETGSDLIMNFDVFWNKKYSYLAAGAEGLCRLYKLKFQCSKIDSNVEKNGTLFECKNTEDSFYHFYFTFWLILQIFQLLMESDIETVNPIYHLVIL